MYSLAGLSFSHKLLNINFSRKCYEDKVDDTRQCQDRYNVPDRITGREGVKLLNPARNWNFIEVKIFSLPSICWLAI